MSFLSISAEIASLPPHESKRYDTAYKDVGYELGFGRGGSYPGHSHLRFVDLMFAPAGVRWQNDASGESRTLVIAPPRTHLSDLDTGDFVFLKFCPDDGEVVLSDKVYEELREQEILSFTHEARLTFPWFPSAGAQRQTVEVTLRGTDLTLDLGTGRRLVIRS